MGDIHRTNIRYDGIEAICTKREKAHGETARAGAKRAASGPNPRGGPEGGGYETTAGSADLGSGSASSSSPMAIPRRLDT